MSDGGKGSKARPLSVTQEEYNNRWEYIFGRDKNLDCHRCYEEAGVLVERMILCPICGNKRCPRASTHELNCTGSNAPGQSGSVY